MIIYLGRRLPGASSDLPGSRDGLGQSVSGAFGDGAASRATASDGSALPPYLVLLPMGFTEPGRSPGLLVSSYLTVSPLPRPGHRGAPAEAVCFLWHCPYPVPAKRAPDGGRYPPSRPVESGLSSAAGPPAEAFRPDGLPPDPGASARAPRRSSRPPRTPTPSYGPRFARTTRGDTILGVIPSPVRPPSPSWARQASPSGRRAR